MKNNNSSRKALKLFRQISLFTLLLSLTTTTFSQATWEYKAEFSPYLTEENNLAVEEEKLGGYVVKKFNSLVRILENIEGDNSLTGLMIDMKYQVKTNAMGVGKILGFDLSFLTGEGQLFYFQNKYPNKIEDLGNYLLCVKGNGDMMKLKKVKDYDVVTYTPLEILTSGRGRQLYVKFNYIK